MAELDAMSRIQQLRFEFAWLSRQSADPVECAALAEVAIHLGEETITELYDQVANTVRPAMRVSAYLLACWFAGNWWRLRWEPQRDSFSWRMAHEVGAAGGGYAWPHLAFSSDGVSITVTTRPSPVGAQPVRYLRTCSSEIPAPSFENAVDGFLEGVVTRLGNERIVDQNLSELWREVVEERHDPDRAAWRKLEAVLGRDPGDAPDALVADLVERATAFGRGAVEEIAADSMDGSPARLEQLAAIERQVLPTVRVPPVDGIGLHSPVVAMPLVPWVQAEDDAATARRAWRIPDGPVHDRALGDVLSFDMSRVAPSNSVDPSLIAGFRELPGSDTFRVHISKHLAQSRRFALARLIGDHFVSASDRLLPATGAKTYRQKYQRAFAQSLLCPFDQLRGYLGDEPLADERVEAAAAHFQVSPLMVHTILVNKGVLDRDLLDRDRRAG